MAAARAWPGLLDAARAAQRWMAGMHAELEKLGRVEPNGPADHALNHLRHAVDRAEHEERKRRPMGRRDDGPACLICGCTQNNACDEGCEWIMLQPPLCSQCVQPYLFAKLWGVLFALEGKAKGPLARLVRDVRGLYGELQAGNRFGLPTLRQVTSINRRAAKSIERDRAARKAQLAKSNRRAAR